MGQFPSDPTYLRSAHDIPTQLASRTGVALQGTTLWTLFTDGFAPVPIPGMN